MARMHIRKGRPRIIRQRGWQNGAFKHILNLLVLSHKHVVCFNIVLYVTYLVTKIKWSQNWSNFTKGQKIF